jgi:alditol oxidase
MVVTNWAGNVSFRAAAFHQPASVPELQRLVAASPRVKALGRGHSFNPIADTTGDLVSLARLPKPVTIDAALRRVTVGAGVTYGELAARLDQAGYALANLASLPHISVAGAVATGTHGSGNSLGSLATAVAAIDLITASGDLVTLSRDHSGAQFAGAVVSLGALGIAVTVTLDIEPTYQVRQYVYENLPLAALDDHLDEVFASAYSVSLFTDWRAPVITQAWLKQRAGQGLARPPQRWLGARQADGPRHPLGLDPAWCTPQLGVPGPWHERLPHFRLDFTPSAGQELQSEYLIPRHRALEAIHAIEPIGDRIAPVLQVAEIRTVAADDLWLSPCYQRDTTAFHFTWIDDPAAVLPVLAVIEDQLAPLAPRPHWGKLFTMAPDVLASEYQRLPDFAGLLLSHDPSGKFRNAFLDAYLPAAPG